MQRFVQIVSGGSVAIALLLPAVPVHAQSAEDASAACTEASRLIAEEDFAGALDEAQWCVDSLRQLKQQQMLTVFPDEVDGFIGNELNNQSAMGMTMLEREYVLEDSSVSVALTGGIAGGGLAALAQFASGMIGEMGRKMRIQKRTVIDMSEEGGQASFMVQLRSGGMLLISSADLDSEALIDFVRAFPIAKLDESLTP